MPAQESAAELLGRLSPGQRQIHELFRSSRGVEYANRWAERLLAPPTPDPQPTDRLEVARRPDEAPRAMPVPPEPLKAAERLTEGLVDKLSPRALTIYRVLLAVALQVAAERSHVEGTTSVAFHLPTELLAFEVGEISRTTLLRYTNELKQAGLIDQRGHRARFAGASRQSGSVWRVRLDPRRGSRVRLTHEDLAHAWRDLEDDVKHGRTAFRWIQEQKATRASESGQSNGGRIKRAPRTQPLLRWALKPGRLEFLTPLTVQFQAESEPYALLDVVSAPIGGRREAVERAAHAVASHLQDPSIAFYRQLVWQLLRRHDAGEDRVSAVYHAVVRAGVDAKEGFAKRAGALFTARLKQSGLLEWLREPPSTQSGGLPLAA